MQEKRRYGRTAMEGRVSLRPENNPAGAITADLINVSYGGICVRSDKALELNTVVQVDLRAEPAMVTLRGKGKVSSLLEVKRQASGYFRIGIDFVEVSKNEILALINARAVRRPPPQSERPGAFDLPI